MLVPEVASKFARVDTLICTKPIPPDGASSPSGGPDLDSLIGREQGLGPAVAQIAQACDLAIGADRSVKRQGRDDGIVIGSRMGADLLELADVVIVRRRRRPSAARSSYLLLAHIRNPVPIGASSHLCRLQP